ncbi:GMC oxidoreductase [Stemphylium lycopersici]|nr:cellobiose dehydrogenase [Stemphylium lycopersici]RAR12039.1 GMC oxidoreductase [Stemphylium lycopersici]
MMVATQIWKALLPVAFLASNAGAELCAGGEWDVIVVGSGPAGIVTADRMSEAGKKTLLLEQGGPSYYVTGGRARPDWLNDTELSRVDVPGLYKSIFSMPGKGLTCASDVVNAFQGCTVGGNTAINAGLFFQPPASDWDRYFPRGWKNKDMQSAIEKVRATQPSTDNNSQDGKRYLQSGYDAVRQWLVDGAGYAEVGLNDGPQNHTKSKVFGHPIWNYEGGQRSGPVKTYLQTALKRPNFSFQTGTKVLRVRRDGDVANGVDVETTSARAPYSICIKEGGTVISSAGALLSPQLLMWSGIGDAEVLKNLSKNGHVTQPPQDWINNTAVGNKVFDNPNTFIELQSDSIDSYVYNYSYPLPGDAELYLNNRSGPYTFASQTSAFWDYIQQGKDVVGCQGTIDSSGAMDYMKMGTITLNVYGTSGLRSFGRVNLDARGIATPASNFYSDPRDVSAIATFVHNIFKSLPSTLTPLNIAKNSTLEAIETWLKTPSKYTLGNVQHWSSSCRMGECVNTDTKVVEKPNIIMGDDFAAILAANGMNFVTTDRHDTYPYINPKNVNLQGKNVLITGASKGIGKVTAVSYAKAGASSIALGARSSLESVVKDVLEAAKSAGHPEPRIVTFNIDVTSQESVEAAAKKVSSEFDGRLDILINNAGYLSDFAAIPDSDPLEWWRSYEVNVKGTYLVTHAFWSLLLASSSKIIINVASIGAVTTAPHNSAYGTSKSAAMRFTEYINQDHGEGNEGMVAIAVHPGGVQTELGLGMPEHMHGFLVDTSELAGDTLLWLGAERREWLGGRYVSANWDLEELSAKKEEIVKRDLLKLRMTRNSDTADSPESALDRAFKKMKSSGSASHAHSSHVTNAVDDSAEDYQPSAFESEHDQGEAANSGTSMEHTRLTHRKMTNAEKEAKQRRLEGQVGFIILTRDNNKPNAYGMCSVTHAPLPWSAVARAYNEKYGVSVTPAAMEKRVRQHRTDWMAKHPAYPVKIVYAHKTRKSQAPRSKANVAKAPAHRARNIVETDVHSNRGTDRHQKCVEAIGYLDSSDRIAGWLPPDHVRNQADIRNYIDDARKHRSGVLRSTVKMFGGARLFSDDYWLEWLEGKHSYTVHQ